jgi:DNA helicase-2/ATP-dependent DNA helicase PcrA
VPFVADLHIHSHLSRATSRELDLEHLHAWAQRKGIGVVATGDFTHPRWLAELREKLVPAGAGLYQLRDDLASAVDATVPAACRAPVRFMLSVEISSIYKREERVRKVHNLVYAPDFEVAATIASRLARIGNIESDGRPILGLDSRDLLEITLASSPDAFLIPAHVWTPWFSALGEKSGFDSIDACFGDLAGHIFAAETGLSSDPAMNWRLSSLDRLALVSSSDAHSPDKLGREATLFACEPSYFAMRDALKARDQGFLGTVEFFPEEGKYHHPGHRACGVSLSPSEAAALGNLCPKCERPLTGGVASRVAALADRPEGFRPERAKSFTNLVPLVEVLGELLGVGAASLRVRKSYDKLLGGAGSEMSVLMELPVEDADREGPPLLGEALRRMRAGQVLRKAGFDGEYGVVRVFGEEERRRLLAQTMFGFAQGTASAAAAVPAAARGEGQRKTRRRKTRVLENAVHGEDPDQTAAILHRGSPLLIVAGPGTGKTRTLVGRIAHLIENDGFDPGIVTAITFTRKAAGELRERLRARVGDKAASITATTFHALALGILRQFPGEAGLPAGFTVLGEAERLALVRELAERAGASGDAGKLASALARAKTDGGTPSSSELSDELAAGLAVLLPLYQTALQERGALDFDDLVVRAVRLLEAHAPVLSQVRERCVHLLVDEYQDVNAGQYQLVRLLAPSDAAAGLCAVGDPDQAIYGFRGSDPSYFSRFTDDYPGSRSITLSRNYRSAAPVVALATAVIERAPSRPTRALVAQSSGGATVIRHLVADEHAEAALIVATIERAIGGTDMLMTADLATDERAGTFADQSTNAQGARGDVSGGHGVDGTADEADEETLGPLAFHDIAVLTRLSAQADVIEDALFRASIPYQRAGSEALTSRPHVADLLARLERSVERTGKKPLADAIAVLDPDAKLDPRRQRAVELLCALALPFGHDLAAFREALALERDADVALAPQKVSLLTLHASKGLEFPLVFIAGCEDGVLPLRLPWLPGTDVDEERRLLYVGMTRAKRRLVLVSASKRNLLGRAVENRPSEFLNDLAPGLLVDKRAAARPRRPRQLSLL